MEELPADEEWTAESFLRAAGIDSFVPANYAAAQEYLERNPHLDSGADRDEVLRTYARHHHEMGDERFRLLFGLRPPRDPLEDAERKVYVGELEVEEFDALAETYLSRPADEPMLQAYYRDLERRIVALAKLKEILLERIEWSSDILTGQTQPPDVQSRFDAVLTPGSKYVRELQSADRFAEEARSEYRKSSQDPSAFIGPCIRVQTSRVVMKLSEFLEVDSAGRLPDGRFPGMHPMHLIGLFPDRAESQAELASERAAVQAFFRKREDGDAKPQTTVVHIIATQCQVKAETASVTANVTDAPSGKAVAPEKLKVPRWSEFGIALHDTDRYAFARAPDSGATVRLGDGVLLPLSRGRWDTLFDLACSAGDGRTLSRRDVLSRLATKPNPSKGYLKRTLSELRIQLASLLDGPADISSLLHDDGNTVNIGFTVRAVVEEEWEGKKFFTFGRRVRSA